MRIEALYARSIHEGTKVIALIPVSIPPHAWTCSEPGEEPWLLFQQRVDGHTTRYARLWEAADVVTPCLGPAVSLSEKLEREAHAERQLEEINGRLRGFPRSREKRGAWREALLNAARAAARSSLGLSDDGLRLFFTRKGLEATRRFVSDARAFDAGISDESLFQALRNLWVVHCIQLLMGRETALSPAVFGYSMLYPWTDNYLDDPRLAAASKLEFGEWLGQRLRGLRVPPPDRHAAQVG